MKRPRIDSLTAITVATVALGCLSLYAASRAQFERQLIWLAAGGAAFVVLSRVDHRRLRPLAPFAYAVCVGLLVLVHVHGSAALGARRWLSVAGFPLEPSEIAKPVMVLVLAALFARADRPGLRELALAAALSAPVLTLLVLQPDLGTALVYFTLVAAMLFVSGVSWPRLAVLAVAAATVVPFAMTRLHGYQRARLEVFLDPARDPLGAGYNLLQARIAVGSGGVFGRGWMSAGQGRLGFIPERTTDFAFATFAEQFGLIGCCVLLALFALLVARVMRAAAAARDRFGMMLAAGVGIVILVQVVENVGMNVGVTPVAGIPLPLFSYGGSSLITTLAALGVVRSVERRRVLVVEQRPLTDAALRDAA